MTSPPVITIKCRAPEQRLVRSNWYVSKGQDITVTFPMEKGEITQINNHEDVHKIVLD
jgi:hypothetical protein